MNLIGEMDPSATELPLTRYAIRVLKPLFSDDKTPSRAQDEYTHVFEPSLTGSEQGTSCGSKVKCVTVFQGGDGLQPQYLIVCYR